MEPWPWYVSGAAIAGVMLLLLLLGKNFGMSANLRTFCTICGAGKNTEFFQFDWKTQKWNLIVALGAIIGGYIGSHHLSNDVAVDINPKTVTELQGLGFESAGTEYLPDELYRCRCLDQPQNDYCCWPLAALWLDSAPGMQEDVPQDTRFPD